MWKTAYLCVATVFALASYVTSGVTTTSKTTILTTTRKRAEVPLTAAEIKMILDDHNKARRLEIGGNLGNLTWNSHLAMTAQNWTDACNFTHHPPELRKWGENLAALVNTRTKSEHLTAMIKQWVDEKKHNRRGTFEECCSFRSNMCCHYTQMIWASTASVGCGYRVCDKLAYGTGSLSNIAFLACYYNPTGNIPKITYDWRPYVRNVTTDYVQRTTTPRG